MQARRLARAGGHYLSRMDEAGRRGTIDLFSNRYNKKA